MKTSSNKYKKVHDYFLNCRYYAAWIENNKYTTESHSSSETNNSNSLIKSDEVMNYKKKDIIPNISSNNFDSSNLFDFENSVNEFHINDIGKNISKSSYISFQDRITTDSSSEGDDDDDDDDDNINNNDSSSDSDDDQLKSNSNSLRIKIVSNKFLYIQMEFCYSTLRETIDKGSLCHDAPLIVKLLRQMLEALSYMHGRRVIHRDLKVKMCSLIYTR